MKEKVFLLRKQIIEELRGLYGDVKINLKSLNPKFDDDIIESILFNSGEKPNTLELEDITEFFNEFYEERKTWDALTRVYNEVPQRVDEKIYDEYITDPIEFFYFGLDKYIQKRRVSAKPYELYFIENTLYINEYGKKADSKVFALPLDVLQKIDFSDVPFDNFCVRNYDFSPLHGVKINPQTVESRYLDNAKFKGVEFVGPFDGCSIEGADFTGSKNAFIDPEKLLRRKSRKIETIRSSKWVFDEILFFKDCIFNSVTFTNVIGGKNCTDLLISGSNFEGSHNAIIDISKTDVLTGCNFRDAYLTEGITKGKYYIKDTKFAGSKGIKRNFLKSYVPIVINMKNVNTPTSLDLRGTDFGGCVLRGEISKGSIEGTSFEGSSGAIIKLEELEFDEETNFSDAIVYDKHGNVMSVTEDGRLSSSISEKLNDIFNLPNTKIISQKAKEDAFKETYEREKKETIEQIVEGLKHLAEIESLHGVKTNDLYSKILISRDLLFVNVDDHLEINRHFIPYLRFLYLGGVDFANVNVAGLDFRKTFADINPQTVYNKDLSNSIFDEGNFSVDADFTDVNIEGANFEECIDFVKNSHFKNKVLAKSTSL